VRNIFQELLLIPSPSLLRNTCDLITLPPLLQILYNLSVPCKGITIILITAHGFINRTFSATSDADGIFGPLITSTTPYAHAQAIYVSHLLRKYRTARLRAVQFESPYGKCSIQSLVTCLQRSTRLMAKCLKTCPGNLNTNAKHKKGENFR
jgi:hypothetical protein